VELNLGVMANIDLGAEALLGLVEAGTSAGR